MKKEYRPFSGQFIKHKNYLAFKELKEYYLVRFDENLYKKVTQEIYAVLGKREKYEVSDAVSYFQTKYLAFRVPWEYAGWYEEQSFDVKYDSLCEINSDTINPFDYSVNSKERNVTLVVDTIYNKTLRNKYPNIALLEQEIKNLNAPNGNKIFHSNPIIVIG